MKSSTLLPGERRLAWYRGVDFWNQVMPVTYQIDCTRHIIHTVCSRPLTFAQVIDHFRELSEDPACSGCLDVLLDVTDVDVLPESTQLQAVGAALGAIRKKGAIRIMRHHRRQ